MTIAQADHDVQMAADPLAGDALYYRGVLHGLIDIGMDVARVVQREAEGASAAEAVVAEAAETRVPVTDLAAAFDRVSRAIRRTIALARRVADPVVSRAGGLSRRDRVVARTRIIRGVEDVIQRKVAADDVDEEEAESLHAEFAERLDGPDLEDDLGDRPVEEIIAELCRDLGLAARPGTQPWVRRTPEDIRGLRAWAARPAACGREVAPSCPPDWGREPAGWGPGEWRDDEGPPGSGGGRACNLSTAPPE